MSSCHGDPGQGHLYHQSITQIPSQSTSPAIALKSCRASRIYPAQEFSAQRGPAKLTICCKTQKFAVFDRVAAQYPAMPSGPAPGMLQRGLSQPLSPQGQSLGAAPMGCPNPGITRGGPAYRRKSFHPDLPPPARAAGRAVPVWTSRLLPFLGIRWADPPRRAHRNDFTHLNANHNIYYYLHKQYFFPSGMFRADTERSPGTHVLTHTHCLALGLQPRTLCDPFVGASQHTKPRLSNAPTHEQGLLYSGNSLALEHC